jgi:hypothetical protein
MKIEILKYLLEEQFTKAVARFRKYDIEYSIALIYGNHQNMNKLINDSVRDTDQVIFISKNLFVIIYEYTPGNGASAALQNLMKKLNPYGVAKLTIVFTKIYDHDTDGNPIIHRLFVMFNEYIGQNGLFGDSLFFEEDSTQHIDFSDI